MTFYVLARVALVVISLSFLFNILTHHGQDIATSFESSIALFPKGKGQ